ncbi:auxin-responsive family protein [Hibiscus syriacus]|uniref:Homeobox-leucine zipper protein n=1 Tax=Hibiscus syriacus TaxID=106335 RepID=A0A6A2WFZ6_HIBSY|nr:auxin-responsive family protein [Hibiscus syriacus]
MVPNKRARRKSKDLEREYATLQGNYNNLASKFEALKKEKQVLLSQLQKLNDLLKKPKEEEQCCGQVDDKLSFSMERWEHAVGVLSDDDSGVMTGYFRLEEA